VLLGGKPRTVTVPAKGDRTVASIETPPRIHVVRLPQQAEAQVTEVTELRSKAS
jgi:hypothetical protein